MDISTITSDRTAEKNGVLVPIDGTTSWLVRAATNPDFKALAGRLRKKHKRMLEAVARAEENGTATPAEIEERDRVIREITAEAAGQKLLVGWEGMLDKPLGKPVPYSPEAAVALLMTSDHALRLLEELAGSEATFRQAEREAAEGNSARTSAGNSKAGDK